jgi:hypothetical protein
MHVKCFARLRNVLRRVEACNATDSVTESNFNAWRADLKAAVEGCFANPLPASGTFDWSAAVRTNVRRSIEPTTAGEQSLQRKLRRAIIDEMCRPAIVLLKSGKKGAEDKALAGLRTCCETVTAGIVRVWADPTDDEAAIEGAAGKLRMVAHALNHRDAMGVVIRLAEAVDPTHHLHLEFGTFQPAERIVSHEGSSRFQQAFDHHRPVPVRALRVAFSARVTGPPPIQTAFVNEQLVDAFWDWQDLAEDAPEPSAKAPMVQVIKFAKLQSHVRSWSLVVSCEHIDSVEAAIDVQPQLLTPMLHAVNGNTRNVAEVVTAPGGLTTTALLRDVVTAALRHFHGGASQDSFLVAVQQTAADSSSAQVFVGAARGAAKTAHFNHAGAKVHVVQAADTGAPPQAACSVVRNSKRGFAVYLRVAVLHAVVLLVLKRFLRGVQFVGAAAAAMAAFYFAGRKVIGFRQAILGAPLAAKTHRRSAGATRRLLAVLAHTVARTSGTDGIATALRKDLTSALKHRRMPFGRGINRDVAPALATIVAAAKLVGELKPDAVAAMGVGQAFEGEDQALVQSRAAVAALFYTFAPGIASALLPGAFVKEIAKACRKAPAGTDAAVDVILRQASLLSSTEVMHAASRCDASGSLMLPPETLAHDVAGLRTLVFAVDRSGVVTSIDAPTAKTIASTLFAAVL